MSKGSGKQNPMGEIDINAPASQQQAHRGIRSPQLVDMAAYQDAKAAAEPKQDGRQENDHFRGAEEQYAIRFRDAPRPVRFAPYIIGVALLGLAWLYVDAFERERLDAWIPEVKAYVSKLVSPYPFLREHLPWDVTKGNGREGDKLLATAPVRRRPEMKATAAGRGAVSLTPQEIDDLMHASCDTVVAAVKKGLRFPTAASRVLAGECHLVRGMPGEALRLADEGLATKNAAVRVDMADVWLMKLRALLAMGQEEEARHMLGRGCQQFQRGPLCAGTMAWLTYRRDAPQVERLVGQFERLSIKKGSRADVMLFVEAGRIAMVQGKYDEAEQRFRVAQRFAPDDSPLMARDIFEGRMLNAYRKGDRALADRILKEAGESPYVDPVFIMPKLNFLRQMMEAEQTPRLREFFLEPRFNNRYLADVDMLEVVSVEAIRRGLMSLYLNYLGQVRKNLAVTTTGASGLMERLNLGEVRAYLAQGQYQKAFKTLKSFPANAREAATVLHLRGVALAGVAPSPQYYALAAAEFMKAYKISPHWQTLWALVATVNQAGDKTKRLSLLDNMRRQYRGAEPVLWIKHVETDMLIQDRRYPEALARVETYLARYPDSPYALNQKLTIYKETQRLQAWKGLDAKINERNLLISNWQLLEMRHYPLGPLALLP